MSRAFNKLAIFERQLSPLDHFIGQGPEWEEVTKAWVELTPYQLIAQRTEAVESEQLSSTRRSTVRMCYTPDVAAITTACRLKLARAVAVDEVNPQADANYRIFGIDAIVNDGERNRELQMQVVERT